MLVFKQELVVIPIVIPFGQVEIVEELETIDLTLKDRIERQLFCLVCLGSIRFRPQEVLRIERVFGV